METLNVRKNMPNQKIDFDYGGEVYTIYLRTIYINTIVENGYDKQQYATLCDIYLNNTLLVAGVRCIPSKWLLHQSYKVSLGNFRFECVNNDYPEYSLFGKTQSLVFYTTSEIEGL